MIRNSVMTWMTYVCLLPLRAIFRTNIQSIRGGKVKARLVVASLLLFMLLGVSRTAIGQMDQGAIFGTVEDTTGALIPGASVTLTNDDTGLVLHAQSNGNGVYVFSPIKIGHYRISVSKPGFATTTQENLRVDVQQRLELITRLKLGATSESVVVSTAPPLLQTEEGSTGTTFSSKTMETTPLSQLNYVELAQMAPGVTGSVGTGARGQLTGDFVANGQRPEQTNYVLDGVDNNVSIQDLMNGASSSITPPPFALSEFKVQTSAFSAEFGHSAGAAVNATTRAGTNQIHGTLWEYFRDSTLNTAQWGSLTKAPFHQNLFGATLGGPILKDKLFFFGYGEGNRVLNGTTSTLTVPTALMQQGNFTELLNPALTSSGKAINLYVPGSAGTVPLTCNGQANVICPNQIDAVAQKILSLYPSPNTNGGLLYNNFKENLTNQNLVWQWGTRFDWNISAKDQTFVRLAYMNQPSSYPPPLGVLDGGAYGTDGHNRSLGENLTFSETHIFTPTAINEARFGYNYGNYWFLQPNYSNLNLAASLGLGGIPVNSLTGGGLPGLTIGGAASAGTPGYFAQHKAANTYQILDNFTKVLGKHVLHAGIAMESVRQYVFSPVQPLGSYSFSGSYTGGPNLANAGYGVSDFLLDQIGSSSISNYQEIHDERWYRSAYVQDDWRLNQRLTLNLGLRYDYFQPYREINGGEANFVVGGKLTPGGGTGSLVLPEVSRNAIFTPAFLSLLSSQNISIDYSSNPRLVTSQKLNFSPRIGFAWQLDSQTVLRGGGGIFFGGLENMGGANNPPDNYPFQFTVSIPGPTSCTPGNCPTNGQTLETGFSQLIAEGISNFASQPGFHSIPQNVKTSYTENYNLTFEHAWSHNLVWNIGYVGSNMLHLITSTNPNGPTQVINSSLATRLVDPFPQLGSVNGISNGGIGNYHSLQTSLNKQFSHGLQFQANYTWAHALGDSYSPLESGAGFRALNMIGMRPDYTNSSSDVRHRVVFNGLYELPFGTGRAYLNHAGVMNYIAGGWSADLQYTVQTGLPFTVGTSSFVGPNGASANAVRMSNPFAGGGTPPANSPLTSCPAKVRTVAHWYNPCAFTNPPSISSRVTGSNYLTGTAILPYLGDRYNQEYGPGWNVVNLSLFKSFPIIREDTLTFRTDIFNLPNIPVYSNPSTANDGPNGGQITGIRSFQQFTQTNRFIQFSAVFRY